VIEKGGKPEESEVIEEDYYDEEEPSLAGAAGALKNQ